MVDMNGIVTVRILICDTSNTSTHPGKSFLSGRLITSDKFQISGIPENECINLSETTILAETLNFCMLKFKVSAKIIVSDQLLSIFSGMPEI
jgi:hypothetical protein